MAITVPVYTTRETVKRALMINETARNNAQIDRCIRSAARRIEGQCRRVFYPYIDTKQFDWPNIQGALPWRIWLDGTDIISLTALSSTGGGSVPTSNVFLEPNTTGPPYDRIEISLATSSSFGAGSTYQESILVTGLWGHSNDETTVGATVEALDSSEPVIDVDGATAAVVGVGSILRIDAERVIVSGRSQLSTGQTLAADLGADKNGVLVAVADGTQFAVDEIIKVDAERMLVVEITGNSLEVIRAFDGSNLAAHSSGMAIYASRSLTVVRGALGTTAAAHSSGAAICTWDPPDGIRQANTMESIHELLQEQTGWFRTMSASSNFGGTAKRSASMESIYDMRTEIYKRYGRKARQRTV